MAKIIRVRTYGVRNFTGPQVFPLEAIDGQVSLWLRATSECIVTAHFVSGEYVPLASGFFIDQAFHFEKDIANLEVYCAKGCRYAIRLLQAGTAYKDAADPIPYRAIASLDPASDTMENRILRAINTALAARGLSAGPHKGVDYAASDEEFGSGYEFDEDVDAAIDDAALKALAKKLAPRSGSPAGVQPTGNDDSNQSTRRKLGDSAANAADTESGDDSD